MGKEDVELKDYFSDRRRYADLWNGGVFGGKQFVRPEELQDVGGTVSGRGKTGHAERTADVIMRQKMGEQTFALWVLENQKATDYSMPVRIMLEEALEYNRQIKEIKRKNGQAYLEFRKAQHESVNGNMDKRYYESEAEFLYHFKKEDKIYPVLTLVVYWGTEEWKGPGTLHEMMDFSIGQRQNNAEDSGKILQELVPEYPLHILDLSQIEDYSSFQTELRLLFELYACRSSKEKFKNYIDSHEECRHMDDETFHMLGVMIHFKELDKLTDKEDKEDVDVCKAIYDWMAESRSEGRIEGRAEGRTEGVAVGEKRMVELTKMLLIKNRMSDLNKALEDEEFRCGLMQECGLV